MMQGNQSLCDNLESSDGGVVEGGLRGQGHMYTYGWLKIKDLLNY